MRCSSGKHTSCSGPLDKVSVSLFKDWAGRRIDGGEGGLLGQNQGNSILGAVPLTIEPLGVILGSSKGRSTTQASVDGGVPAREVDDCSCIELPLGGDDSCGVVARVIGAAGHTIDLLHSPAEVPHLGTMERW